jgi:hypothetical protein
MPGPIDPFPTIKLTVPFLSDILAKVRDEKAERTIVVFQAESAEQGDWVLQNVASRLGRSKIIVFGPEPHRPVEIIEQALRMKAVVALVGDLRRAEDTHAMRTASGMGLKSVGYIVAKERAQYAEAVAAFGPWRSYNILSLVGK